MPDRKLWIAQDAPTWLAGAYFWIWCPLAYLLVLRLPLHSRAFLLLLPAAGVWAYSDEGFRGWIDGWRLPVTEPVVPATENGGKDA